MPAKRSRTTRTTKRKKQAKNRRPYRVGLTHTGSATEKILALMRKTPTRSRTPAQLGRTVGVSRTAAKLALFRLLRWGRVTRTTRGEYRLLPEGRAGSKRVA